jgi:hypothetical protein
VQSPTETTQRLRLFWVIHDMDSSSVFKAERTSPRQDAVQGGPAGKPFAIGSEIALTQMKGGPLVAAALALLEFPPYAAAEWDGIRVHFIVPAVFVATQIL